ncbi:uncharacterized protein TA06085 [Theileria annulata]|uniref:Eukaryotic translation initiation factor 2A n=1 Tax=Theileria annulata TaxID=5874 RepID=Q4UHP3_THEAN|nr:uncharacterized protein TA06085 [Theileria annulata]CAI73396.1 hypothetical protein, conserved [Theileria annulata]|eukprot:XP_954073.1 hypothetical protein, conserved [Theileria annulata]
MDDIITDGLNGVSLRDHSMASDHWFLVALSKKTLHIYKFYPKTATNPGKQNSVILLRFLVEKLELFREYSDISKSFVSNKGNLVCLLKESSNSIQLTELESSKVLKSLNLPNDSVLKEVVFSPLDTFLTVLTSWSQSNPNNLVVYNLKDPNYSVVLSLPYEKSYVVSRFPTWTQDESFCILRVMDEIKVWKNNDFSKLYSSFTVNLTPESVTNDTTNSPPTDKTDSLPTDKTNSLLSRGNNYLTTDKTNTLPTRVTNSSPTSKTNSLPSGATISLSPPNDKGFCYIGIFASNQGKFDRGVLRIYSTTQLEKPIFNKEFDASEEGELFWNSKGTSVLFRTFANSVKGLASYYGANSLYLINLNNSKFKTISTVNDGIIHDISWSRNGKDFLLLKGPMPAEIDLYDGVTGLKTLSFGKNNRNTVKRDPFDRLVLMGGFGNLRGEIDIWDMKTKKKISQSKSECSVSCEFSPDGMYFVTATTVPRMRVDCCFKIFSYSGKLVQRVDFEELYHVYVRNPKFKFRQRDPSPSVTLENSTTSTPLYRPPGSLSGPKIIKQTNIPANTAVPVINKPKLVGPPGADAALLSAASKIKKKNRNKK